MKFVYYHAGNMRVLVVNTKKPTQKTYVWSKTGNQGNTWKMATVDLGQLPAGYKVCYHTPL